MAQADSACAAKHRTCGVENTSLRPRRSRLKLTVPLVLSDLIGTFRVSVTLHLFGFRVGFWVTSLTYSLAFTLELYLALVGIPRGLTPGHLQLGSGLLW